MVAAFNIVFVLSTVITALAAYRLARRVTGASRSVAWLAGLLFAWSPVLVARSTAHMSLVAAAPLPVFVLCLLNAERSRQAKWAVLTGLTVAWAAFCDVYFAVYCLMIGAGFVTYRLAAIRTAEVRPTRSLTWALDILLVSTGA